MLPQHTESLGRSSPSHGASAPPAHPSTQTRAFTLTDFAAVIGGSIGIVYLVGYLVLAAHQRALGIGVRSTDTAVLIGNAWEFGYRGTLIAFITALRWTTKPFTNGGVLLVIVAAVLLASFLWWAFPSLHKGPRPRRARPLAIASLVLVASVFHMGLNTVPLTGIQDLLFSPSQVSPFSNLPEWLGARLTRRVARLQSMLVQRDASGAGLNSTDADGRAALLTSHMILTVASLLAYLVLRRKTDLPTSGRFLRRCVLVFTILHAVFAPIFYGVLLKSYRYPQVRITMAPTPDPQINRLYADFPLRLPFLLDSTNDDLYLYFAEEQHVEVVRRAALAQLQIVGHDFVLGVN